jgi:hypothetical protein
LQVEPVAVTGQSNRATVPDTLDLADHAGAAINVMTRAIDPVGYYCCWQSMNFSTNPPYFRVPAWLTYKWLESLPHMRQMSGSDLNLDIEQGAMQTFVDHIDPSNGLLGEPVDSPAENIPSQAISPLQCSRLMLAMNAWHDRDGDPRWKPIIHKMAEGLDGIAIRRSSGDRTIAYYPEESGLCTDGVWRFTERRIRGGFFPYFPPDMPDREQQGLEAAAKFEVGTVIRALVMSCRETGNEATLQLARDLLTFCRLPGMWEDTRDLGVAGWEHGVFAGHFHGNTMAIRGMLDIAVLTGDQQCKELVREAYEYGKNAGIPRLGWTQGWVSPLRHGKLALAATVCEGCSIGNMIALAIGLTDAGMGDYWDDVDHFVRNQLVEQQYRDIDRLREISALAVATRSEMDLSSITHNTEDVFERALGAFGEAAPDRMGDSGGGPELIGYGCCTGNGSLGFYYAWEGAVRHANGVTNVNLLLNRASRWVDVDSWLPYEGRVLITVKDTRSVAVRVPGWVDIVSVGTTLDGEDVEPLRAGRYLVLTSLRSGQKIELRFDVPTDQGSYLIPGHVSGRFNITFRGSTAVSVVNELGSPGGENDMVYRIYRRDHLKGNRAPVREVTRFVGA